MSSARQHILETAARLFFKEGYRAVGIDTIVAESGVAKMTLYRHFPSKDDLIVAYLEYSNTQFWDWFEAAIDQHPDQPRQQLIDLFDALEKLVTTPTCYGCPFLNAATEFPEADHPGHRVALEHKQALRSRLAALAQQAGAAHPAALADLLLLLMDGAFMAVRMFGQDNPANGIGQYARQLIDCHLLS